MGKGIEMLLFQMEKEESKFITTELYRLRQHDLHDLHDLLDLHDLQDLQDINKTARFICFFALLLLLRGKPLPIQ